MEFTTLEIVLTMIIWIIYGVFNTWQHDWCNDFERPVAAVILAIIFAPIALCIRIIRGVFVWRGKYVAKQK
jgi:uncharacterized protein YneF (UPF0154 family)